MPKSVQIRDVPDDVHRVLRTRAAAAGLSLSEFLRREITAVAEQPTVEEVLARAAARSGGAPRQAIVDVIRAARDADDT
jgi:plasmid stability protein